MVATTCLSARLQALDNAVGAVKNKKAKIAALHQGSHPDFKEVFGLAYDPNIKFLLPSGVPPFKTSAHGIDSENILLSVIKRRKLAVYMAGQGYDKLTPVKRETMFMNLLTELHPDDAVLLCHLKDKKLPFEHLTKELIKEAFPQLAGQW